MCRLRPGVPRRCRGGRTVSVHPRPSGLHDFSHREGRVAESNPENAKVVAALRAGKPPEPLPVSETAPPEGDAAFPESPR